MLSCKQFILFILIEMTELIDWKVVIGCVALLQIVFWLCRWKVKHAYRISQSYRVLTKVRSIEHDGAKLKYLKQLDPYLFEECILTALQQKGNKIRRNKRYSGDGGLDGTAWINGEKHYIQAKCYENFISRQHVLAFCSLVNRSQCKGLFVHTGKTTGPILDMIKKEPSVTLISGEKLIRLLC